MPKIKLVVFDMDNVLFDVGYQESHENVSSSSWEHVWNALGSQADNLRLKKKWSSGGYSNYTEWQSEALKTFKSKNLTKDLFFSVIEEIPLMKGAKETVEELRGMGIKTAIISGSFFDLALRARRDIGIDFPIATASLIFNGEKMVGWSVLPFDYEGKMHIFDALVRSLGIKPEECAFVCDGVNDIELAKTVGLSIAFCADEKLRNCCMISVDKRDLREIIRHIKDF